MTQQQIRLVKESWKNVTPLAKEAGLLFYDKLFDAAPGVRSLFKQDVNDQANKLVMTLGYVVAKLDHLEELLPEVQKLGARHNHYRAEPAHYEVVGNCLIATLKEKLADQWNAEIQDAWIIAYNTLRNIMIIAQENQRKSETEFLEQK